MICGTPIPVIPDAIPDILIDGETWLLGRITCRSAYESAEFSGSGEECG